MSKPRDQAAYHRTDTNGHQHVNALVEKETYDFLADYRGLFSFGVGLDRLVEEVKRLREKLNRYESTTTPST